MTLIATLYNHKGGVSKTTTTFNLAHAIAERKKQKVLLVDADPQCNLTELFLARQIEKLDEEEAQGTQTVLPGTTILQALAPRLDGERADVDVDSIQLVPPTGVDGVYLLRGDVALSEAEDKLSYAHSQRMTSDMHQRRNYIVFHDMLRRLGDLHGFDWVFVDVGPSAGALTRSCFLACDRFLVPVAPDRFNFQAIGSLSRILERWVSEHSQVVPDFKKLKLNVAEGKPEFRGLIMQRFQRYAGAPKSSYKVWMQKITERTTSELLPSLISSAGSQTIVAKNCFNNPTAVEIHDFASLAPMMLTHGKPVWRLTQSDTGWAGVVWEQRKTDMDLLRSLFFNLADQLST
ncbi:ParA family protein [Cystobacter fuscus]|uniref:ParA family protein n=1 Tax=Cystobacter fuscus TaxID=43 RepID=UPI002B2E304E|nr:ParA family protein [Cystobacter fuscus]